MFREVRKKVNEIDNDEIMNLLVNSRRGVLSTKGDDGYPYAIPINYIYDKERNSIVFHTSKSGHKINSLKNDNKVCFTILGDEEIKDKDWAPYVKSVIVFGKCRPLDDFNKAMQALKKFAMKFYPSEEMVDKEIEKTGNAVQMFEIEIGHMTGKQVQES